jgi:hypothetical protein
MEHPIQVMGLVRQGELVLSVPSGRLESSVRVTRTPCHAAEAAEAEEIDLSQYEGCAIMVRGDDQGRWIHSAEVVDVAGPILSAVVERLSGLPHA